MARGRSVLGGAAKANCDNRIFVLLGRLQLLAIKPYAGSLTEVGGVKPATGCGEFAFISNSTPCEPPT